MRLLLAEDDKTLGASLKKALEQNGYGVDWVQDGVTALQSAQQLQYSVMVLDINMPKMSGLDVLRTLRQQKNKLPVLVLTARNLSMQKVEGLDSGADDYLIKPFDLEEMMARLRSLQRRHAGRNEVVLRSGAVELEPAAMTVAKNGEPVTLTAKEFRLLKMLMERAGRYVTKNDIEYGLYNLETTVESNTIEVTIYTLRKKLGNDFIQTIRGVGYMVKP